MNKKSFGLTHAETIGDQCKVVFASFITDTASEKSLVCVGGVGIFLYSPQPYFSTNFINPFLFMKNKRLFISSEGFSTLAKNALICYQRQCCPSSRVWQPSTDRNVSLAHFLFNFNFLGRVWQPSADNNGVPNSHYYLQKAVTPNQITRRIVCRGQEPPKGSKGILKPDFKTSYS